MKPLHKTNWFTILSLVLLVHLFGQVRCPAPVFEIGPASQAEVNAGLIGNKYVSPATLNGGAVATFANAAKLDASARADLTAFQADLTSYGVWGNLVDAVLLKPRFNPTNALSLFLKPLLMTNMVYSKFGALFAGTNSVTLPNFTSDVSTNSVVVVWRYPFPYMTGSLAGYDYVVGLDNSNGGGIFLSLDKGSTTFATVWERANTAKPWPEGNSGFTNIIMPPYMTAGYDYHDAQRTLERHCMVFSSDGTSNMTAWQDAQRCALGLPGNIFTITTPLPYTNALTNLRIGFDLRGGSVYGTPLTTTNFAGEIAAVLVFNKYCDTNLAQAVALACRELEPETTERYYIGDSRMVPNFNSPTTTSQTNAPVYYYQQHDPLMTCYHNFSQSGIAFDQPLSVFGSNLMFGIPLPGKVTRKEMYVGVGINAIYGGAGAAATYAQLLSLRSGDIDNGFVTIPQTLYMVGTNAIAPYTYNAALDLQRTNYNNLIITNAYLFAGVWRMDKIFTVAVMNTNNGFTTDGTHPNGASGWIPSLSVGNAFFGNSSDATAPSLTQ